MPATNHQHGSGTGRYRQDRSTPRPRCHQQRSGCRPTRSDQQEQAQDPAPEQDQESVPEQAQDPVPEQAQDPVPEQDQESVPEQE